MLIGLLALLLCLIMLVLLSKQHNLIEFLEDDQGNLSFIRLGSLVCLYLLVVYVLQLSGEISEINGSGWGDVRVIILLILMIASFFPKLLQKIIEKRVTSSQ